MLDLDLDRVGPLLSKAHIRDHSRRSVVTCLRAQALIDHGEEVCGWRLFRSRVAGDHRDLAVSFHGNGIRKEFPMLRQQLRCERECCIQEFMSRRLTVCGWCVSPGTTPTILR